MTDDKILEMFGLIPNPVGTGHDAAEVAQAEAAAQASRPVDWNDAGGNPLPSGDTTLSPAPAAPVLSISNSAWTPAELIARLRG